ncbi:MULTISPECIES: DUF979 domain-containing protein [unclassified Sphingomonas]|uniref:DUF979 domain-containing protein n=1 Tax=unclassified Sphingomonas TaxID=196159 RepID=UPI000929A41F|nr:MULTISPECIES: DUF979 domain-containing protein [unclassified Sphingomonas]OJU16100.1 MAG: hypothetical protein BGN95_24095 [Sphingomonas sp. 66-10]
MIGLDALGVVSGLLPAAVAVHHALHRETRDWWRSAAFWALFAASLIAGPWLPDVANGMIVLAMVALATAGLRPAPVRTTSAAERAATAKRLGSRLFLPALCIPAVTLAGTLLLPDGKVAGVALIDPKQVTLVSLAAGAIVALGLAIRLTAAPRSAPAAEARRLTDAIGWAMILPQMLAALGGIFAAANVGQWIAMGATTIMPLDIPFAAVLAYCLGMALFTIVMGNAFAAFPIMTAGIGLPFLIHHFGGNPAPVAALGMLSGFCGTLMTPMAANFNIVPVAALELRDRHAVIRAQIPTALILLGVNIAIMALSVLPGTPR